jgi:plasmid stabilization system protein ParE
METFEVIIMPQADEELEDIAYFIAVDSPQTSQRFVTELITTFTKILGHFPESGSVYKADVRKFSYKGYTAFYQINVLKRQVEILHLINLTKPLSQRNIDF